MTEIHIQMEGRAGRITLQRPQALNALTYDMIPAIEAALDACADDDAVRMLVLDAEGDKAFCAGGDIADLYAAGLAGDFGFGRRFWRDEYRLNAKLADYVKPIVTFLQGFTMGGGVGIGCHASHRVVGDASRIAMPECGIGLIPEVGGSLILAQAPGRLGEYLGLTGARLGPGDAIHAGFADHYLPEPAWPESIASLCETGDPAALPAAPAPAPSLDQASIDRLFAADTLPGIAEALAAEGSAFATSALKALQRNSPLSMAATLLLLPRIRAHPTIHEALRQEYRFTWRASEDGDFLEGIRAQIIDKDRAPRWQHALDTVTAAEAAAMLAPLGAHDLTWEDPT